MANGERSAGSSATPSRPEEDAPLSSWRSRLHAVGSPSPGGDLRMAPGRTDAWRAVLLLWIASDHLPDRERRAAAAELVDDVFRRRLHGSRVREARRRGIGEEDLREWAAHYLVEGVWRRERGTARYDDLVHRLRDYLNDRIAAQGLGPDWKRVVGKLDGDPPASLDAPPGGENGGPPLLELVGAPDGQFGRLEARATLRRLVARADLTDGERACLLHRKVWGRSVEQTAERVGYTEGSVRVLTSRAMTKLREAAAAA